MTESPLPREQRFLALLLLLFIFAATLFNLMTPLFEMSDELWHYPMVKRLADGDGLVVQDPANVGPWRQQGSQAPLYYYLAAGLTFWIDTADMPELRRENPHVDNGLIRPDGNANLIIHRFDLEGWPWQGTELAVHIARFFSTLLSAATLYFTYLIGVEVFPRRRWLALAGAATAGLTPMFTFVSGSVNNDTLAYLCYTAGLWLMLVHLRRAESGQATWQIALISGVVLGAGALAKVSNLGLFGLAGLVTFFTAIRQKRWQAFFLEGPAILGIAGLIAGWWYWRNWLLYRDPLGLNMFVAVLGQRARPASLAQLWTERQGFMQSYWGLFGGVNVPMAGWVYAVLNLLAVAGMIGLVIFIYREIREGQRDRAGWLQLVALFLAIALVVLPLAVGWARNTWSSQGRLVFYAISAINLLWVAGLAGWLPENAGKVVAGLLAGGMALLSILSPFVFIRPAYALPAQLDVAAAPVLAAFSSPGADSPALYLLDARVEATSAQPGDLVWVTLTWEALMPMDRDWSLFIHLRDEQGFLVGQRDLYPGNGSLATSDLHPGRHWQDRYAIPISPSAYAPEQITVLVGLYDYRSCPACVRMETLPPEHAVPIARIALNARPGSAPNPLSENFGGEMLLTGYTLSSRSVVPGEAVILTLHWQALRVMERDYTISAQVLAADTTRWANEDSQPLDGARPTSTWAAGETILDEYYLALNPETPPGAYQIQVVVYWQGEDGAFNRLQRITPDGRLIDDFLLLTPLRVLP